MELLIELFKWPMIFLAVLWVNVTVWFTFLDQTHVIQEIDPDSLAPEDQAMDNAGFTRMCRQFIGWPLLIVVNAFFALGIYYTLYSQLPPFMQEMLVSDKTRAEEEFRNSKDGIPDKWNLRIGLERLNDTSKR